MLALFPNLTFFLSDGGVIPAPNSPQIHQLITANLPHFFDHSIDDTGVMSYVIEPRTNDMSSAPFISSLIGSINWGESSRVVCVAHVNPLEVVPLPAHILVSSKYYPYLPFVFFQKWQTDLPRYYSQLLKIFLFLYLCF